MKHFSLTALLVCLGAIGAYAVDDHRRPTKPTVQKNPVAIPRTDKGDIPPRSGTLGGDDQRVVSRESREYLQKLQKRTPFGAKDFDLAALRAGMGSRREPVGKGIQLIRVNVGEIPCEWVVAVGANPDVRLLYLHGGGFVSGSGGYYLTLAAHLSAAAKCAVLLPDYRLAPEHRFPAAIEDCSRAHEWMIANGPAGPARCQATFIAGDSAGGSLTLATLLALRDRRLPLPAGGIALSPTTDLTLASESLRTVNDPIISARTMPVFRDHYLGKTDPRNPLASPVFGDYHGLPPLLIQVGEHEMLRDDSIRAARKARADGVPAKLEVWPGMFHVFQSHEPLLPEGQEAIDHIADFMRSALPRLDIVLSQAHIAAVNRQRRIYVNNDAGYDAAMGPKASSLTPEAWLAARFSAFVQPGSQVDSVGWCLDEGNIAAYPSKIIPELQYPTLLRWRKEGVDLVQRLVEEGHCRKLEVFWEHRLNGADRDVDVSTPARHPLKDQHPEWLIPGSWWKPGLWNFAVPEVRKHKLAVLREVAERYDLDGLNLDFGRHPPYLPTGKQWEHREALTDFVRQTRLLLQGIAERRGRPFLLSVRVADTVPGCHFDGMDVETWVRQNLVDMIILGTRSIQVDLPGFRRITAGSHVKLYPCIDQHHSPDGYHAVAAPEFLRGLAANWWHQGADGIATFNFWNEMPEAAKALGTSGPLSAGQSVHAQAYREMGDPKRLTILDKWFVVARRYGGGFYDRQGNRWDDYLNLNHQAPLPLTLGADPAWVEVYVADDMAAHGKQVDRLALRLRFSGQAEPRHPGVKFNGIKLQDPKIEADWWTYALTPRQLAVGRNLVTVDGGKARERGSQISLEKVEVHVNYRPDGFVASEHQRRTIYHSPQSPGYTCWCGAWIMPDGSLMTCFTQATGPLQGRPRGPENVLKRLSWPPPGQPDYDMTGLKMENVHLRSRDSGKTWQQVSADAFKSCMNGATGMAEVALPDGTVLRAVEGFQLPYNPEAPQTGYLQRSHDSTKTWGKPEVLLDPAKFFSIPKRLRLLKDGRLLLVGGFAKVPANSLSRHEFGRILQPLLLVSADGGKSWSERMEVVPVEHRQNWGGEAFDAAELANGDLLCVFRRLNPLRPTTEVRWQGVLKKAGHTWVPAEVGPAPFPHSGHPELLATREGPTLHIATSGVHWTIDAGKTWHTLDVPGTAYYPRAVQAANGRILVFGHVGGDDAYGKVDQSIVMDSFLLKAK